MPDTEPAIVDALTHVAMSERATRDDLLQRVLAIADGGDVSGGASPRPASAVERQHALALVWAFGLRLQSDELGRSDWEVAPFAKQLDPRFGPPGELGEATQEAIDIWAAYAATDLPPLVVAHLSDLVAARRIGLPSSADRAIAASLDLPGVIPAVYAADHLARGLELCRLYRRTVLQAAVEDALVAHARQALTNQPQLGTFVRSVRPLVARRLRRDDVSGLLEQAVDVWAGDPFALRTVHELRRDLLEPGPERVAAEQAQVQAFLDAAAIEQEGIRRLAFLQDAYDVASRYGHAELAAQAQAEMRAIPRDSFDLEPITMPMPFPPDYLDQQVQQLVGSDHLLRALLRLVSACPTGDSDDVHAKAVAGEATGTLEAIFGSTVLNAEMMPKGHHAGGDLDASMARLRDIHLAVVMPILTRALMRVADVYAVEDGGLSDDLAQSGDIATASARKLARTLRRFWREDFEGAAYVGVTLVEGLLRERLLAVGVDPYQVPEKSGDRPGKYKTLWSLIDLGREAGFDASWMDFLEHALCNPSFGPNTRNELDHGAVSDEPDPLTAATVLVAAVYLALSPDLVARVTSA